MRKFFCVPSQALPEHRTISRLYIISTHSPKIPLFSPKVAYFALIGLGGISYWVGCYKCKIGPFLREIKENPPARCKMAKSTGRGRKS